MQSEIKKYKPSEHDKWRALTVKQPYASNLVTESHEENGVTYGIKSIEVRSQKIAYRGDIMICSSATPVIHGLESGVCVGLVEMYGIMPVSLFTEQDWENTGIPAADRHKYAKHYGWLMRNPRRVIEFPIKGQLNLWHLVFTKDTIIEYPRVVKMDKKSHSIATKK